MNVTPLHDEKSRIIAWRRGRTCFRVGDRVRVGSGASIRRIESIYQDVSGGVRLDREVAGFVSWNVADLVKAARRKSPR